MSCRGGLAGLLVALVAFVLAGCGGKPTPKARPSGEEPYVIGAMFAITGDASSLGIPEKNTVVMLERQLNAAGGVDGHPIRIVVEDTKGEPAEALNALKRLVERDQVLAVVGPTRTGETMAVADYAEKSGVPLLSCALGIEIVEPVKPWVFKTPASDRAAVSRIAEYLKSKQIVAVATLSDNTSFGKSGLKELEELLPAAGIKLVAKEEYGPKDVSMESQLAKIKASGAKALICWGTPPGPGLVARQMKQLALSLPLICSQGVANQKFLETAGPAAEGTVVVAGRLLVRDQLPESDPQKQTLLAFAEEYQKETRAAPDVFAGHAWDGVQLLVNALKQAGPDRARLRETLEQTQGFVGIDGVYNFSPTDHCGLNQDAFVLMEVKDGGWKLLPQ